MHEKLDYFFDSLLKKVSSDKNHVVSKKEIFEHLIMAGGVDSLDELKKESPYVITLMSSGACKGEYIDLNYDSSLYYAFIDISKNQVLQWYNAYFEDNNGFARDISIIENKASEVIAKKVRGDYINDIENKTIESAIAFSQQRCSLWLKDCVIKSALTHKNCFSDEDIQHELFQYSKSLITDHVNKTVEIKKGNHLSVAK